MSRKSRRILGAGVALVAAGSLAAFSLNPSSARPGVHVPDRSAFTATPIKHVVVLFDENVSYDHYFGTYPKAANTDGTTFHAARKTPANDNLSSANLLASNPNLYLPKRLSKAQAMTCDQNHAYGPQQQATDNGAMDLFVQKVSVDTCSAGLFGTPGLTMDYYDGNTVTGLWNYAQHYAMSDHSFGTGFGPSTPGALNLIAGQTHGFTEVNSVTGNQVPTPGSYVLAAPNASGVGTVVNDPDPAYDDCSDKNHTSTNTLAAGSGKNIGDLLNARGVSWGWFQGGFRPTTAAGGSATYSVCGATHANISGASVVDYSPHHNPFEYYASTSNPHHLAPTSVAEIGHNGRANHQYDVTDFDTVAQTGHLPAVSFVKAGEYQDGHAGYSDPVDEQDFLVHTVNEIEKSPQWRSTAIVIAYDDSDGWYDHVAATITNSSHDAAHDAALCSGSTAPVAGGYQDRCGPGPRLPLVVISPYTRTNFIDHSTTTQSSILKFVEDNWRTGRVGDSSTDAAAGSLNGLFDFGFWGKRAPQVLLRTDGTVKSVAGR